jgi:signal transduction histidine kinase
MINAFYNNHLQTEKLKENARQLEEDQEKIRELGQFRQALINMVVHDMKTPLSHIISTLEGFAGSAAERLKKSGKQLLILVENILDVNKMENQKLCLEKSVVNLRSVSLRATEQVEHLYQKKSVRLENHLFDNLMVYANAVFLERIFINLLTNSIKYTPPRGKVSLFCNPLAKDQVSVKIHDTGKGIPKEKIPYVFNYYYQSDQKKLEKIVPTGIGLTFCKLAVEEHNGEIGVESDGKNGTTFWFTLPLSYSSKCIRENKARVIQSSVIKPDQLSIPQEQIEQLRKTPVYKASSILETLDQVPDENADVTEWKTQVKRAVFSTDVEFYNKLTDRNGR